MSRRVLKVINCSGAYHSARANIFPENAGRSLCTFASLLRPHFSRFSVMPGADEIAERVRGKARRWLRRSAGNLFAQFYLGGMRDRINRRVNRISCPIPKEAYGCGIATRCLPISLSLSTMSSYPRGRKLNSAHETCTPANSISRDVCHEMMS